MTKNEIREIAYTVYTSAVYMYDYDMMGFVFEGGKKLLAYVVELNNGALKKVTKDEFELLKKALVERINESIENVIFYANYVNSEENTSDVIKEMTMRDKNKEIEEYQKFIKWVEVDFTFELLQEYC